MNFEHLWILFLIPFYLVTEILIHLRKKQRSLNLPTVPFVRVPTTWRTIAVRVLKFFPVFTVVLLLLALSNPQFIGMRTHLLPSGIDIVVALDVSGSMAAEDFQPLNRLAVAKDVLRDFIRGRPSDRIGLIAFAGKSVTRSPLTVQHDPLIRTVESIRMGDLPEGTAIGSAIMSGLNRLSGGSEKQETRILVLLTDGRNNTGEIHPLDALSIAVDRKIKIYTIGVGSFGSVPFPLQTPSGKKAYEYAKVDLDEDLLRRIADRSGGKYFRATDPKSLQLLFAQINSLEKSDSRKIESRTVESWASVLMMPALVVLFCYILLTTVIVRLP